MFQRKDCMVAKAAYQLRSSSAPGEDGIYPEFLKPLDVVDLSWLTHLCRIGYVDISGSTSGVGCSPILKRGTRECPKYSDHSTKKIQGGTMLFQQCCARFGTSNCEAIVYSWKMVYCPFQVSRESLPKWGSSYYLRVLWSVAPPPVLLQQT